MDLPEKVARYVRKPEFLRWCDNPEEPRGWTEVVRFLDLTGDDRHVNPADRLKEIRAAIQAAFDWCKARDTLIFSDAGCAGSPIHVKDLTNLLDFLQALIYRFPEVLESSGEDEQGDDEKPFWDWD
jgi:hypothetical protein